MVLLYVEIVLAIADLCGYGLQLMYLHSLLYNVVIFVYSYLLPSNPYIYRIDKNVMPFCCCEVLFAMGDICHMPNVEVSLAPDQLLHLRNLI